MPPKKACSQRFRDFKLITHLYYIVFGLNEKPFRKERLENGTV
jgi:hypothetical protein